MNLYKTVFTLLKITLGELDFFSKQRNSKMVMLFFCIFALSSFSVFAQQPTVSASIDSTKIKIGEQILYGITVETDSTNLVVFPEGQSFQPLEVVESIVTDTTRQENRFKLYKEYVLTQFDSGSYTIPQQKVLINNRAFLTDSMQVIVRTVDVDTTKQKMFPIKPAMEVSSAFEIPNWIWYTLGILIVMGIVIFLYLRRKRKKEEAAKKLPPYEQALFELQELDRSHLLEERRTKEYYSKLTEAVRRYLEDEVHLRAMESTTSEVITYLELKMNAGELKLSKETIQELKIILQRADMAKFANSKPDIITAKADRSKIEHVINDTKDAIPAPTEEELLRDEQYRLALERKRKRRKKQSIIFGFLGVVAGLLIALIAFKGTAYVTDALFGNTTKEFLEGEWIRSEYGEPTVVITTPEVLIRTQVKVPEATREMMIGSETFASGKLSQELFIAVTTLKLGKDSKFDMKTAMDGIYSNFESQGAKSIIMKDEEFSTVNGRKGTRVYGTLQYTDPESNNTFEKEYSILNFGENNGFEQISVIYEKDDKYAQEIASRVINSVEFQNTSN